MIWFLALVLFAVGAYFFVNHFSYWHSRNVHQAHKWTSCKTTLKTIFKLKPFIDVHMENYRRFPKARYIGMYHFNKPMLMIRDPDLIKQMTVKDSDYFHDRQIFFKPGNDIFFDSNLFALTGERWRKMRSTISPAFTTTKMKAMFILMNKSAKEFTSYFVKRPQENAYRMKETYRSFATDVIANCAFGYECNSLFEPNNEFYKHGMLVSNFASLKRRLKLTISLIYPSFKAKLFDETACKYFLKIVQEQLKVREEQNIVRPDMIHLLMQARKGQLKRETDKENQQNAETGFATVQESDVDLGKSNSESGKLQKFTDIDIAAQVIFLFVAGFDTISTTLSFVSYELALNPEIQERLRQEIEETNENCDGNLTYEALFGMKYMDMVISESLRKWPPSLFSDRKVMKPYLVKKLPEMDDEIADITLEANSAIVIPFYAIHHDPKNYPKPEVFDPERFNDENKKNIKPYTYLPFGMGPRSCIGSRFALMEIKTLFYNLLLEFEICVDDKTQIPVQLGKGFFNLDSSDGIWLKFKKRN